jgi:Ohr subfamily peroxiredoxin
VVKAHLARICVDSGAGGKGPTDPGGANFCRLPRVVRTRLVCAGNAKESSAVDPEADRCYAACFLGAVKFVASQGGPKVPSDATVTATVGIGSREERSFGLTVALSIAVPGVPRNETETLVAKAHQVCPYSNATRNNIDVKLTVE